MSTMSMIYRRKYESKSPLSSLHTYNSNVYILMFKAVQDLDLPEGTLAVGLMFKGAYFLNSHFFLGLIVQSRTVW